MPTQLATLTLVDTDPATLPVDALVVGVHSQPDNDAEPVVLAAGAQPVTAALGGRLLDALVRLGATGTVGEVTKLATLGTMPVPVVVAVGLGPAPGHGVGTEPETLRRAAGSAVRALAGSAGAALLLPVGGADGTGLDQAALRAVAEGALLGGYRFTEYKTTRSARTAPLGTVRLHVPQATDKVARAEVKRAAAVAGAVAQTRDWVNTAPNDLRPPGFAEAVAARATAAGLTVEIMDEKALRKGGFGGISAVGQGSGAPPRLVRIEYAPRGAHRTVALVGKGITFDTGGISLKPAANMGDMKGDMAGAAAVAATMLAVAALKPKVAVTAYVPMAENMPSGTAYRPGDVVTMRNGKKVEVFNTDAEGRLILADAIALACESGPDYLLETSTLTGGQVVALGKRIAGVMGSTELCERVRAAGESVGEPAWPMPLPDDVRKGMESDVADVAQTNTGGDRSGAMAQGGIFLSEFVTDEVQWAHIDVAGPAMHGAEPTGYLTRGGTGVPVRTLLALIESIAAE